MNCPGLCRQYKNSLKQGTVPCFIFNQLFLIIFYMSVFLWHNKTSYGSFLILP